MPDDEEEASEPAVFPDAKFEKLDPNVTVRLERSDDRLPARAAERVPQEGEADTAGEHGDMAPETARGIEPAEEDADASGR
jgi:hypothetical protein